MSRQSLRVWQIDIRRSGASDANCSLVTVPSSALKSLSSNTKEPPYTLQVKSAAGALTVDAWTASTPKDNKKPMRRRFMMPPRDVPFPKPRRSIANDCFALAMKRDHYNAIHPDEAPLQVVFNFEEDIEEMKIAKSLDGEEAA